MPPRSEAGFTLLELAIATAILALALLLASGLLVESGRVLASAARELVETDDALASRQLTEDLRAGVATGWGGGGAPLDLASTDRTTRWELVGERLERRLFDRWGADLGARPMLDGVESFVWLSLGDGVVRVEIVRRTSARGAALRAATARWTPRATAIERTTVIAGSRRVWGAR
jgi:prepilin-type N-terminal cleavage/methylation domain-containing protein